MEDNLYSLSFSDDGDKICKDLDKILIKNNFQKVYDSPEDIFHYGGRSGGRIIFLEGFRHKTYIKENSSSIILTDSYSTDSPNDSPRNNIKIKNVEIKVISPTKEITDLIESVIQEDLLEESERTLQSKRNEEKEAMRSVKLAGVYGFGVQDVPPELPDLVKPLPSKKNKYFCFRSH